MAIQLESGWIWFGCGSKVETIVAGGFKPCEGKDFGQMFAPTVLSSCVQLLCAFACGLDFDGCFFVVGQAFVQSKLDKGVCLRFPQKYSNISAKMVRLNKSRYELRRDLRS